MNRLLIKEYVFLSASATIVIFTAIINWLFLPNYWPSSPEGILFVEKVSEYYPGLMKMKQHWQGYTPEIGVLFSSMAIGMPFHLMFGFLSAFFFPHEQKVKRIYKQKCVTIIFLLLLIVAFSLDATLLPYANNAYRINQASEEIVISIYSWLIVCISFFMTGQLFAVLLLKLNELFICRERRK